MAKEARGTLDMKITILGLERCKGGPEMVQRVVTGRPDEQNDPVGFLGKFLWVSLGLGH